MFFCVCVINTVNVAILILTFGKKKKKIKHVSLIVHRCAAHVGGVFIERSVLQIMFFCLHIYVVYISYAAAICCFSLSYQTTV